MSKSIPISQIDRQIGADIKRLSEKHPQKVAGMLAKWPNKFLNRAISFYPSVLNRPTGRLIRSFTTLTRRLSETVASFGLRAGSESDPIEYARPLHDGYAGVVRVPAHRVKAHTVRAHTRNTIHGAQSIPQHRRRAHIRGPHSRRLNIRARYFFATPMRALIPDLMADLRKMDRWD